MRQISIFIQNKRGRLTEITKVLADNNINICGTCLADTTEYGILRMVVDKPELAAKVILKCGYTVNLSEILAVEIPDAPGELYKALDLLDGEEIGIEYLYSYVSAVNQNALIYFKTNKPKKAFEVLKSNNYKILTQ
ncbi:acetolactate synthase [Wukongibacter sp. M2B1]|uniref:acetolactate synthase n=1 Tax=Wukongibacter sp. M2B1 TaxID=3088895 RepID=UPI003D79B35B